MAERAGAGGVGHAPDLDLGEVERGEDVLTVPRDQDLLAGRPRRRSAA